MEAWRNQLIRIAIMISFIGFMSLGSWNSALAVPITFMYEGRVDQVIRKNLFPPLTPAQQDALGSLRGTQLRVQFTFDSTTSDSDSRDNISKYRGALSDLQIGIGPHTFTANMPGSINEITVINNGVFSFPVDTFRVDFRGDFSGSSIEGLLPSDFLLLFRDESATALDNTMLPTLQLDTSEFPQTTFLNIMFDPSGMVASSDLSGNAIPEPSTLHLFAAGLIGLLFLRWKKHHLTTP